MIAKDVRRRARPLERGEYFARPWAGGGDLYVVALADAKHGDPVEAFARTGPLPLRRLVTSTWASCSATVWTTRRWSGMEAEGVADGDAKPDTAPALRRLPLAGTWCSDLLPRERDQWRWVLLSGSCSAGSCSCADGPP